MVDLAVIVPTRGRPGNIRRVLQAWTDTEAWGVADLVMAFDADDPEYLGYVEAYEDAYPHLFKIEFQTWQPMVHKLDQAARSLAATGYFAIGFAGDDHLPRTGGWTSRYVAELRRLGTGIVYGDDGYQGARLPTQWAITSDIVRALDRMVPAPVEHMYCDNSILDLGRAARCIQYLSDVKIEHVHPMVGKTQTDAQYQRVNSRDQFRRDRAAYQRWHRRELAAQAAIVRSIMPAHRIIAGQQPAGEIVTQPAVDLRRQRPSTIASWPGSNRDRKAQTVNKINIPRRLFKIQSGSPPNVMVALADLASQVPADRAIVELGVFRGATALIMAWGARQGHGAHVWGIDAWDLPGNPYGPPFTDPGSRNWARYNVKAQGMAGAVTLIHGFSLDQAEQWPEDRPIGLLFVDDDHSHEAVRRNIQEWGQHLADDAVIAFDDYGHPDWPGVKQAVDEMVDLGVLEPVQIFHDRLAVTKLGQARIERVAQHGTSAITSMTSEGAAVKIEGELAQLPDVEAAERAREELANEIWPGVPRGGIQFPLPSGTEEGWAAGQLPEATEGDQTEREHPGTGEPMEAAEGTPDGTEHTLNATESSVLQPIPGQGRREPAAPPASGRPVEPAGKAQTVPMTSAPAGTDADPNVAVARETVLPGEVDGVITQTTVTELSGVQLRELAKARGIALGRGRRTDDWLRAVIRAGRAPES